MGRRSKVRRKRRGFMLYPTDEFKALLRRLAADLAEERGVESFPMTKAVEVAVEDYANRRGVT